MFLMPSRYEPCGLNQMYSMRYGTVPIVRATGGLDDAVTQFDAVDGSGTGFKFTEFESGKMLTSLRTAVAIFGDTARWRALQRAGMTRDFSWNASAKTYVSEYKALVAGRGNKG